MMSEDYKNRSKRVAICLITDNNGNMLMGIRNDNCKWTHPGGHVETGEDPYMGAIRELKEETNLDVKHINLRKVKWKSDKNILLYIFDVIPEEDQTPDPSNDPDEEAEFWMYVDPNEVIYDLHIPLEENDVLKYWAEN